MNRRRALASIGGILAVVGCLSREPETPAETPTETPTATPDNPSLSDTLSFDGDVVRSFSSDAPARIDLRITNRSEGVITATDTLGPVIPFAGRFGYETSTAHQILLTPDAADDYWFRVDETRLVPVTEVLPTASEAGCWRIPAEYDGIAVPPGQISREIDGGVTVSHRYTCYHMHECVPGTYHFSQSVALDADGAPTEEYVPLHLRVDVRSDGDVELRSFGIPDAYSPG